MPVPFAEIALTDSRYACQFPRCFSRVQLLVRMVGTVLSDAPTVQAQSIQLLHPRAEKTAVPPRIAARDTPVDDAAIERRLAQIYSQGDLNVILRVYGWKDQRRADFHKVRSEAMRGIRERLRSAEGDNLTCCDRMRPKNRHFRR